MSGAKIPEMPDFGDALLALHNAARSAKRLPPLEMDEAMRLGAEQAANEQQRRKRVGHFLPLGTARAENAAGEQQSEEEVHDDWMRSSGHKRNILGPYKKVGFARAGNYWTARFR